jgi:hypothetical protein
MRGESAGLTAASDARPGRSFNASFKRETLAGAPGWDTPAEARRAVFAWITRYNTRRSQLKARHYQQAQYASTELGRTSDASSTAGCSASARGGERRD